jgi:hypothetical protein
MQVTILNGQKKAVDLVGQEYDIEGIEIRIDRGDNVIYKTNTSFYLAACPSNTKCEGYILSNGKIMLL